MFHFYALPSWALSPAPRRGAPPKADPLVPQVSTEPGIVSQALDGAEMAGMRAVTRAESALGEGGEHHVFARPPNDLPALLRLADELLRLAHQDEGAVARVWQCDCGMRYGVPSAMLVPMSLACERCGRHIELEPDGRLGAQPELEPEQARVNAYRAALSEFFREAMARGWPVLVRRAS